MPVEELKKIDNLDDLRNIIIESSIKLTRLTNPSIDNYKAFTDDPIDASEFNRKLYGLSEQEIADKNLHKNRFNFSDKTLSILKKAGPIGLLIGLSSTAQAAQEAESNGDTERAKEIWIEFAVSEAGSEIAGTSAGFLTTLIGGAVLGLSASVSLAGTL